MLEWDCKYRCGIYVTVPYIMLFSNKSGARIIHGKKEIYVKLLYYPHKCVNSCIIAFNLQTHDFIALENNQIDVNKMAKYSSKKQAI